MDTLTRQRWKSPEFVIDYVLRVGLVVGLAVLFVVLWPERMFRTPLVMIPPWDWSWALVSALLGGLTVLAAQCVVKDTVALLFKAKRPPGSGREILRASDGQSLVPSDE